ncbi:MAG: DUF883 family protein [Gammaproteobacteria bacterium]|nr:DUF883 family protein [Gammaproteobacteria bacterium]
MSTTTDKEMQALRDEFSTLKSELSEVGKTVSKLTRAAGDEGRDRIRAAADQSRQQARETWGSFESEVEQRPMTSIAAALGIGFILGKLLER